MEAFAIRCMSLLQDNWASFLAYIIGISATSLNAMQAWVKDNGFWYQLTLSLSSALIFYLAFNVIPQRLRKRKLRLLIVRDLKKLKQDLFFIFCTVMQENIYNSAGSFQTSISSGKLRRKEMYLGAQNKCFEKDCQNDPKISAMLFPIDDKLRKLSASAIEQIDKIFNLSEFASTKELTLIEDIRRQLNKYSLEPEPSPFKPVISNCAYLVYAYYPLYLLFNKLSDGLRNEKCISSDDFYSIAAEYKKRGEYEKSIKAFRQAKKRGYSNPGIELQIATCYHFLNKPYKFHKELKQAFKNGPPYNSLVSCRSTIMEISNDSVALEIIKQSASADQYDEMLKVLESERLAKESFINQNLYLSEYFSTLSPGYQTADQIND